MTGGSGLRMFVEYEPLFLTGRQKEGEDKNRLFSRHSPLFSKIPPGFVLNAFIVKFWRKIDSV